VGGAGFQAAVRGATFLGLGRNVASAWLPRDSHVYWSRIKPSTAETVEQHRRRQHARGSQAGAATKSLDMTARLPNRLSPPQQRTVLVHKSQRGSRLALKGQLLLGL
jgi:hypothetical protein